MKDNARPTLLIDGDVIAYRSAAAAQKDVEYPEDGLIFRWAWKGEGEAILDDTISSLRESFDTDNIIILLTEVTQMTPNWRSKVLPDYKRNRVGLERPQILAHLRGYLRDKHGAESVPGLEADDLLGMMATSGKYANPVIVTIDKDLRCVPGKFHVLGRRGLDGKPEVEVITPEAARLWHMAQTLAGDRVDGYTGCPGLGMTRAQRILEKPVVLNPEHGVVTRGPRKGETTTKWVARPTDDVWACVSSHYFKEGLSEEDALTQARVAYILQDGDYDWDTGEVRMWEPYR